MTREHSKSLVQTQLIIRTFCSRGFDTGSFNATDSTVRVAQWIARLPPKEKAAGSNPASGILFRASSVGFWHLIKLHVQSFFR